MEDDPISLPLTSLSKQPGKSTRFDISTLRTPVPTYRHAAPSAPWPWMNFDVDDSTVEPLYPQGLEVPRNDWKKYPQNLFGNWTPDQVGRSGMLIKCSDKSHCTIYTAEALHGNGQFDKTAADRTMTVTADVASMEAFWDALQKDRPDNIRIRALFVDSLSKPVLQMLGTTYNIEPFFFSSSTNWIPSRYQEDPKPGYGDHITITLPFICTMRNPANNRDASISSAGSRRSLPKHTPPPKDEPQIIDTQLPLALPSAGVILLQDLLAIHMVRGRKTSTIISYHPIDLKTTSAKRLCSLVQRTGDSVYWSKIFDRTTDPTFLFLAILWYALYAWDEAFEALYHHISKLESEVLRTNDIVLTRELHKVQAHLLHYQQLLQDFRKSVIFVKDTPNPAMESRKMDDQSREEWEMMTDQERIKAGKMTKQELKEWEEKTVQERKELEEKAKQTRKDSADLMNQEAHNLLSEIDRLEGQRTMQSDRLQNVMRLAFASVNIEDSRAMKDLTEASLRDSAAMKQISYLTMIFLPASLMASVFGMNVAEINPGTKENLAHFAEATVALTVLTAWLVIALQLHSSFWPPGSGLVRRLAWPIFFTADRIRDNIRARRRNNVLMAP
ncbi:hypothetical protein V8B97DRAFT_848741 [Scleroderma yunnanense]